MFANLTRGTSFALWSLIGRIVQSPNNPARERANFIAARWNLAQVWVCFPFTSAAQSLRRLRFSGEHVLSTCKRLVVTLSHASISHRVSTKIKVGGATSPSTFKYPAFLTPSSFVWSKTSFRF